MTDSRIRILSPLLLACIGLAMAGCITTPVPPPTSSLPTEQVANDPGEVAFPDEEEAPEAPPEELEAQAPAVEPLAPAVVYGDVLVRIRGQLSLPQPSTSASTARSSGCSAIPITSRASSAARSATCTTS